MIPVTVYAESTPNPSAMKFVTSQMLLHEGVVEYGSVEQTSACPLARQLFAFTGVKNIFITSNFVTVTKEAELDWYEITGIIREFIRGYLTAGEKVFTSNPFATSSEPETKVQTAPITSADATEEQIIRMLEEYVKPAVEQDGGAIHFKSFRDGIVTLQLKGSCSGCPSSTVTLKAGIENLLKQMVPGVTGVEAEAE